MATLNAVGQSNLNSVSANTLNVSGITKLSSVAIGKTSDPSQTLDISGTLGVTGITTLNGPLNANGITCNDFVATNTSNTGTLGVTGLATFSGISADHFTVTENATIGTLGVTGPATFSGITTNHISVTENATIGTLGVTGLATFGGISADNFTATGNATIGGTLGVTGLATFSGISADHFTATGKVGIGGTTSTEQLKVYGDVKITGNIDVDGSFNFKEIVQTTINNTVIVSSQLDISNEGTGPALKVSQQGLGDGQDVALFNAGSEGDAFKIDSSGNTFIYKNIHVNGDTHLQDVSCTSLTVSGEVNMVGDNTNNPIITITSDKLFDTIVIRRISGNRMYIRELQCWINNINILPVLATSTNISGQELGISAEFFDNSTNLTLTSFRTDLIASNVANNDLDTPTQVRNATNGASLYIPLNQTYNIDNVQSIVLYNSSDGFNAQFIEGVRIELYNKKNDPVLSNPLAYTNTITDDNDYVYRFDFPAINTYNQSFIGSDSIDRIVRNTYAVTSTDVTYNATRNGLKIENAGLEVLGYVSVNETLDVRGQATFQAGITTNHISVTENATIGTLVSGTTTITSNATIAGTLDVTGTATFSGISAENFSVISGSVNISNGINMGGAMITDNFVYTNLNIPIIDGTLAPGAVFLLCLRDGGNNECVGRFYYHRNSGHDGSGIVDIVVSSRNTAGDTPNGFCSYQTNQEMSNTTTPHRYCIIRCTFSGVEYIGLKYEGGDAFPFTDAYFDGIWKTTGTNTPFQMITNAEATSQVVLGLNNAEMSLLSKSLVINSSGHIISPKFKVTKPVTNLTNRFTSSATATVVTVATGVVLNGGTLIFQIENSGYSTSVSLQTFTVRLRNEANATIADMPLAQFFNQTSFHLSWSRTYTLVGVVSGTHNIQLIRSSTNLIHDQNDFLNITIMEMPY